jgi:hypothetical protein
MGLPSGRLRHLAGTIAALTALTIPGALWAKGGGHELLTEAAQIGAPGGPLQLLHGWNALLDGWKALDMLAIFALAAGLGAVIAYHPRTRRKASTIEELEQPKTFTMYGLIGALIAIIVQAVPAMSLVIFAIGGLMRFRTNVGPAKDTGRVILTAVVGVCCGLKLMLVAVLATACGWILLFIVERANIGELVIRGLAADSIGRAADAYRRVLVQAGCRVVGERKKLIAGQVTFVFESSAVLDRESFERVALASVPAEVRGTVDWDIS